MNKEDLRQTLKEKRKNISCRKEKDTCIAERVLCLTEHAKSVFVYLSRGTEADTHAIVAQLSARGKRIYIPYTDENIRMHAVPLPIGADTTQTDRRGNLRTSPSEFCDGQADVAIVPLIGFDDACYRIGQGGGCYDRYFAAYPAMRKIGIAYSEQRCEFAHEPHDIALDCVITPDGVIGL